MSRDFYRTWAISLDEIFKREKYPARDMSSEGAKENSICLPSDLVCEIMLDFYKLLEVEKNRSLICCSELCIVKRCRKFSYYRIDKS